jgi:DNA repair photolyase
MRWEGQSTETYDEAALPGLGRIANLVRSVTTPEFRDVTFHEVVAKSALNRVAGNALPFNWTVNPYRGCSHACRFCFARPTHSYLDLDMGEDFDRQIVVKTNVVEVLRRELGPPSWTHETVALGTNTDPYQRAEGRYRLMPGIIEALTASGTPFSILTKGTLLRRDLGLLESAAQRVRVGVAVSIDMTDAQLQDSLEPGAPGTRARIELVRAIRSAGLECGVMVAPVLPWLTDSDEQLDDLLGRLADAGASGATLLTLHLRPGTKEWFMSWLEREHPGLVKRYEQLYGRGAYVPASYQRAFTERVRPLLAKHGFDRGSRHRRPDQAEPRRTGVPVFEQQSLF